MILVNLFLRCFFLSLATGVAILCLHVDVNILKNSLSEISLTEIVQESILFLIVLIHLVAVRKQPEMRQCNVLIAGFFMAMLIRELDGIFDLIHHGSWVWFALIVSIIAVAYASRQPQRVLNQLTLYTAKPAFGMMLSGLLATLVFSRLFGMSLLWHSLLQDGYVREVKNMVEEGTELFGYILCLAASVEIFRQPKVTHR
ncbi:TPA: transporter [Kluyvera ascorbata]|nr:transporter [Kluyvera ascorbata]